jgi:hypothetical protein
MQFEHKIAGWEIRWGRLGFRKNLSSLSNLQFKRFTMIIEDVAYNNRKIDHAGRVWVGIRALKHFRPGDALIIEAKDDTMYVTKKV